MKRPTLKPRRAADVEGAARRPPRAGLGARLFVHEFEQRAQCRKGCPVDLIVIDREPESLFKASDQGNNGHRIEFGDGPEQCGPFGEICRSPVEIKHIIEYGQDLIFRIQVQLQSESQTPRIIGGEGPIDCEILRAVQ